MNEYSIDFYSELELTSATSAKVLVPLLLDRFKPSSVVDFGCGSGEFVRAFIANGVADVVGLEGEWILDVKSISSDKWLRVHDLKSPIDLNGKFDMAICLEVAEHLPSEYSRILVKSLVNASDRVIFSAAIPGQSGTDHINLQFPEYWATLFQEHQYYLEWDPRPTIWNQKGVAPWYQQNLLVFHKALAFNPNPTMPEKRFHPEIFPQRGSLFFKSRFLVRRVVRRLLKIFNIGN